MLTTDEQEEVSKLVRKSNVWGLDKTDEKRLQSLLDKQWKH